MSTFYFDVPGVRTATVTATTEDEARNILASNATDTVQWGEFDPTGPEAVILVDTDRSPENSESDNNEEREKCDECDALVPTTGDLLSPAHESSCSLHPDNTAS